MFVNFPGSPVLLNDIQERSAVINRPIKRVVVRWLILIGLLGLLLGLLAWSYSTSSELSSEILTRRVYNPALQQIRDWESQTNPYSFTCGWTGLYCTALYRALLQEHFRPHAPQEIMLKCVLSAHACIYSGPALHTPLAYT